MKLALNGATIMHAPIQEDVAIAAECGYGALEIWAGKLHTYLQTHAIEELAEQMHGLGIAPWCINSIEDITFRDTAGRSELADELRRTAALARAIGAPAIVVVPGCHPDRHSRTDAVRDAAEVLRMMSDVSGDVGLAFEFLGKPGCAVPTLDMAIEIVARVDRPNVGMVIDTFHFHAGGSRLDDLRDVPVEKLTVLHLNGCEDRPRDELTDAHRLYPGDGPIPIGSILGALRDRDYNRVASVEIFRPQYWAQDPRQVARTAYRRAVEILMQAGYVIDGSARPSEA